MFEIIVVVLTACTFAKATKNRGGSYAWGIIGVLYYAIGRFVFSLLLYSGYRLLTDQRMGFRVYKGLAIVEVFGGMLFAVITAYVLGQISGLNIKRIFLRDQLNPIAYPDTDRDLVSTMKKAADTRIAVLIDADNVPSANVKGMMEEIAKYGTPTFKRIYGDWTKPNLTGWKNVLLESAITPVQQYSYTIGKNATDSAMIIDAMDILYSDKVDAFAIVSSDSDFTRLALRLREAGMTVIGLGERKTPNPFIVACDKFIYLEILTPPSSNAIAPKAKAESRQEKKAAPATDAVVLQKVGRETINLISHTITDLADDTGWAFLGEVGSLIIKKQPDFDPRNFGYSKLAQMLKKIDKFEVDERETEKRGIKLVYVRVKV